MAAPTLDGQHFDTVIIGAGMSGISAGIRLAMFQDDVLILERHNAPGGLNSFYSFKGRKYDVGLHAITNYSQPNTKGSVFGKLLRQLRITREDLALKDQTQSRIAFPGKDLYFNNDFEFFKSQIAEQFPASMNGFLRMVSEFPSYNSVVLAEDKAMARERLNHYIKDDLLCEMLLVPNMFYGNPQEHDMTWNQFVILFRSLMMEGFARPHEGVRRIIKVLLDKYRSLGGKRKMKCGVKRMYVEGNNVTKLELDSGDIITADKVVSTIGYPETLGLVEDSSTVGVKRELGNLGYVESMSVLDAQPKDLGCTDTITFYNNEENFTYANPKELIDTRSGVFCVPNNYQYDDASEDFEGMVRLTVLANYKLWKSLPREVYLEEKVKAYEQLTRQAVAFLPKVNHEQFKNLTLAQDTFTPTTVERFTGHHNGAIYGIPNKVRSGKTNLDNLFLAGTDQGQLGIMGALLSGVSMANAHVLMNG